MKKKLIVLLFTILLTFSACGSMMLPTGNSSANSMMENIKVSKDGSMIELTIPKDYMEESSQEELTAAADDMGVESITLNEDGSATYLMTPEQHEKMVADIAQNITDSFDQMLASDDYKNFTSIEANEDFTVFTITTTTDELDFVESFSSMTFYMYGNMYNAFNGTPVDNIHVDFINASTGEVISTADSSQMNME